MFSGLSFVCAIKQGSADVIPVILVNDTRMPAVPFAMVSIPHKSLASFRTWLAHPMPLMKFKTLSRKQGLMSKAARRASYEALLRECETSWRKSVGLSEASSRQCTAAAEALESMGKSELILVDL